MHGDKDEEGKMGHFLNRYNYLLVLLAHPFVFINDFSSI